MLFGYLVIQLLFIDLVWSQSDKTAVDQCLKSNGTLLTQNVCQPQDYDKIQRPRKSTRVETKITLVDLSNLDEERMTITTKLTIRTNWNETRLFPVGNWTTIRKTQDVHGIKKARLWLPSFHIKQLIKLDCMLI